MREPFPLQWPTDWQRTPASERDRARFQVTLADAVCDLLLECHRMGASACIITSDLPTNSRGLPYSSGRCQDPGVAVWLTVEGHERVIACDRWTTPAANVRAIGKTIESLRGIERWGAADMVARAFSGFVALPAPQGEGSPGEIPRDIATTAQPAKRPWREVLGLNRDAMASLSKSSPPAYRRRARVVVRVLHRQAMKIAHPDVGGTHDRATELNVALQEAFAEIGGL